MSDLHVSSSAGILLQLNRLQVQQFNNIHLVGRRSIFYIIVIFLPDSSLSELFACVMEGAYISKPRAALDNRA